MKKKYLTYAGIISAIILMAMFIMVFFIKSPVLFLMPIITIDPINDQNLDDNNFLILTGKTNLPEQTHIFTFVYPVHKWLSPDNKNEKAVARGDVWMTGGTDEWSFWKGTINVSSLEPSEYQIAFKTVQYTDNFTTIVESEPVASLQFTLGDENCIGNCIRKKIVNNKPYIRMNPISEETGNMKITGITNLVPGTPLIVKMEEKTGTAKPSPASYLGNNCVIQGIEGVNRWSFQPDTRTIREGLYQITVATEAGENEQIKRTGKISDSLEFNYSYGQFHPDPRDQKRTGTGSSSVYYTIDALPEIQENEKYVISGTTNLPPGELLLFQVSPPNLMLNYNFSFNPRDKSQGGTISGIAGCTDVLKGSDTDNYWAFEMQTYSLAPGRYEVNISNPGPDTGSFPAIPGSVSYTEEFTVHGES
ncbi:MAG: hypothetical protein CVV33_01105 [Methanomicrobiales archaeon HGW-Methanomicrobiales-4]|nr:MAG: hypothetical protein CVV33_01105 [Methanomicrobiales archaeon HGW-Methanomicrobiales-4]